MCRWHTTAAGLSAHAAAGVDIDGGPPKDLTKDGVLDVFMTKWWAIKLATDAAMTVLKVRGEGVLVMAVAAHGRASWPPAAEELAVWRPCHDRAQAAGPTVRAPGLTLCGTARAHASQVDQIIMSKQAGGPKPRGPGGDED